MKTLSTRWFSNTRGYIGIVLAENEFKQMAYMASVKGSSPYEDAETAKDWGSKLTYKEAVGFFGDLVNKETYNKK